MIIKDEHYQLEYFKKIRKKKTQTVLGYGLPQIFFIYKYWKGRSRK